MTKDTTAQEIARLLGARSEKVVLAESCTAGLVAATLGKIPGISRYLCGSAVTYQPSAKRNWLGVRKATIAKHTTESQHVANEMAFGVLRRTRNADWAVTVVGHFGPDAPAEKDGQIFICVARRTKKGNLKVCDATEYKCNSDGREKRQSETTEAVLMAFARVLHKRTKTDEATVDGDAPLRKEKTGKRTKKKKAA